jgi:AcrR family transcriptional regulator
MASNSDESAGLGRQQLDPQRIVAGAVVLADEIGVDALTIRKLAAALDVKPMAIYHHIPNKDAIIDAMVDSVFGEIDLPQAGTDWQSAMRKRCASARAVLAIHPWAVPLMDSRRSPGTATLRQHDAVIGCLREGGLSIVMTAHAYALLDAFVYGFAIQQASLPATTGVEMTALAESITECLSADDYPHLMELTTEHVLQPHYDFVDEFEFGLELILQGLEGASQNSIQVTLRI